MATTESAATVNGNYGSQAYEAMTNNYAASNANNANSYGATQQPASTSTSTPANNSGTNEIPKDEVGWYFVEQYYTTLSKSPEKLYLFYNKRSQFVSGTEEDKIPVCIGQKSINDRIKELDFHDCKVRVTNVDSQGADANIVIQVIGELSNKGQPHKRFVQTFVLAEQTNGYFVLNDIFRYLAEEPEEEEQIQEEPAAETTGAQEPAPTAVVAEDEPVPAAVSTEEDMAKVDEKLENASEKEETSASEASPATAAVNGTPVPETAEVVEAEEAPVAAVSSTEEAPTKEPEEPKTEAPAEPEKPKETVPTPAAAAPKPAPPAAAPAAPPKPAAPRTWASLIASSNKVATPNVPSPVTAQAPAQPKASAPAPSQPAAAPAAQAATPAREPSPANSQSEAAGWQTAGAGHKKEQSRAHNQVPTEEPENKRAYIKNVYSQVEEGELRSALSKFGEIVYLDIARQKNCAFVDFKTAAGFQNAVNNNPHTVNGLEIRVEERRTRPSAFAPFQRGGARGGRGGPVGGQGPRGGFQARGGRGGPVRGGRVAVQDA
jgi:hypothetical protein